MTLNIALLQLAACGNDQQANLEKGGSYCREATRMGADIALFPEMWNIGYHFPDYKQPDALATFVAIAPEEEPRLYIIGCMEELGPDAPTYHRQLGRSLPMRDCDRLYVVGTHASHVCAGVLDQDDFTRQIEMTASLQPIADRLAGWRGSVFVKGSRRYQLEKVLELQPSRPVPC